MSWPSGPNQEMSVTPLPRMLRSWKNSPLKDWLLLPDVGHRADEVEELLLRVVQLPVEPGQLVVLAVGVVVAVLRVAQLVAAQQHRHAL
jgi:hypothetical protein